jgi:hypothetical protein
VHQAVAVRQRRVAPLQQPGLMPRLAADVAAAGAAARHQVERQRAQRPEVRHQPQARRQQQARRLAAAVRPQVHHRRPRRSPMHTS